MEEGLRLFDTMKNNLDRELVCELNYKKSGKIWHLWTNENHSIIFSSREDFIAGMNIMGIVARLCPEVKILTFELMSNHIHIVAVGTRESLQHLFDLFKQLLTNYFRGGRYSSSRKHSERQVNLIDFKCNMRELNSVAEVRTVIAYDNRNGYLVSPDESPYSYPWGANRYYFNPDAKAFANQSHQYQTVKERQKTIHSHIADQIMPIKKVYGYACPLDFCYIDDGESMFVSASQYFHSVSRAIESYKTIAQEISERIFYTDEELYSAVCSIAWRNYQMKIVDLDKTAKTEIARLMHYDYNASQKQIARVLKLPLDLINALFPANSG